MADLSDEQRRVLESVIGQPLSNGQVVHWVVTTSARDRNAARHGLERTLAKLRRNLDEKGVSQSEWNDAVDEAVQQVRVQGDECESS